MRILESGLSKTLSTFKVQSQYARLHIHTILQKKEQLSLTTFPISKIIKKLYLVKICPNHDCCEKLDK